MKHQLNPIKKTGSPFHRVLSAFLSFTMVLSAIFGAMPPLEVAAAGYEAGAEEEL